MVLPSWLTAVEWWANEPIRPRVIIPPPRPLEIKGVEAILRGPAKSDSPCGSHGDNQALLAQNASMAAIEPRQNSDKVPYPVRMIAAERAFARSRAKGYMANLDSELLHGHRVATLDPT